MLRRFMAWASDRRRGVFRYHDGQRWRSGDPLALFRGLRCHEDFDWNAHPGQVELECLNPEEKEFTAMTATVGAVRDVFGVPSFESGGLTDEGCLDLLVAFVDHCDVQKKSGSH